MTTNKLEKSLSQLGFPLLEVEAGHIDVNKTLAEVVRSDNARYWEAFPVLLVNADKTGNLNVKQVETCLKSEADRRKWRKLVVMSLALYRVMRKRFNFADQLDKKLSPEEKKLFWELRDRMGHAESFKLENKEFNVSRLTTLFDNYMQEEALKAQKTQVKHDEFSLEYALSQFFSPKQKELFKKKLNGEPLNKTEREYFSRTVKKKVVALANPELSRLAQKLLE
ncbi:MAG: hypothetical protein NUV91_01585 [Candidatus Omnitrophica bacterium]|nr:hypothetical protein [Candidatus Omnitrophota bacterium]